MTTLDLDAIEAAVPDDGGVDRASTLALVARVRELEAQVTDAAQAICGMADHATVREARVRELEAASREYLAAEAAEAEAVTSPVWYTDAAAWARAAARVRVGDARAALEALTTGDSDGR